MKWLMVMALVVNGELVWTETDGYESKDACEIALARAYGIYGEQGIPIQNQMGGCYMVQQ